MKKILAVLFSAALVLSLTVCSGNSEVDSPRNSKSDKNSQSERSDTPDNSGGTSNEQPSVSEPEPVKELGIWDVLPEIPVTDMSEFEYEYDSKLGGIKITAYNGTALKVRGPKMIEGEPVVNIFISPKNINQNVIQFVMPDTVKDIYSFA